MPSAAYREAIDRAALMVLAALRDHAKPQYSSVQLEAMRLRGGLIEGGFGQNNVRAVFTDIRQRATTLLAAELKTARVRRRRRRGNEPHPAPAPGLEVEDMFASGDIGRRRAFDQSSSNSGRKRLRRLMIFPATMNTPSPV